MGLSTEGNLRLKIDWASLIVDVMKQECSVIVRWRDFIPFRFCC